MVAQSLKGTTAARTTYVNMIAGSEAQFIFETAAGSNFKVVDYTAHHALIMFSISVIILICSGLMFHITDREGTFPWSLNLKRVGRCSGIGVRIGPP